MGETLAEQIIQEPSAERQDQATQEAELYAANANAASAEDSVQAESEQVIAHQHADGFVATAESIDAVGQVCPAMEGMSHRQVMLAIKMAARGRERLAKQAAEKVATQNNHEVKPKQQQEAKAARDKAEEVVELNKRASANSINRSQQPDIIAMVAEQTSRHRQEQSRAQERGTEAKAGLLKLALEKLAPVVDIKAREVKKPVLQIPRVIKKTLAAVPAEKPSTKSPSKPALIPRMPDAQPTVAKHIGKAEASRIIKPASFEPNKPKSKMPELRLVPKLDKVTEEVAKTVPKPGLTSVEYTLTRREEAIPEAEDNTWFEEPALYRLPETAPLELTNEAQDFAVEFGPASQPDKLAEAVVGDLDGTFGLELRPEQAPIKLQEHQRVSMVEHVVETTTVSPEVAEQATTLLVVLPEQVQVSLKEYIAKSAPEVVEAVEAQIVMISKVADRLHELVTTGAGNPEEVKKIEQGLTEQYAELLNTLGADYDQKTMANLINLIKSADYVLNPELLASKEPYDPMRERQFRQDLAASDAASDQEDQDDTSSLARLVHQELGRLMVYHSQALAA